MKRKRKSTNRATEFSKDLARSLKKHVRFDRKFAGLVWEKNWHPRLNSTETVDVAGLDKNRDPVVLIEAELLREDPASNVVKIWKWAHETDFRGQCLFIHSFAKAYRGKKREARKRTAFLAKRMEEEFPNIRYVGVGLGYNPRPRGKVGAGRRHHHAKNLALSVVRMWRKHSLKSQ
jgi:hypothetical protein